MVYRFRDEQNLKRSCDPEHSVGGDPIKISARSLAPEKLESQGYYAALFEWRYV